MPNPGGPGPGGTGDIINDAHDTAKNAIAAIVYPDDVDEYPVAVVLKNGSGGYVYAHGQDTKNDYDLLVAEAKARLDVAGIGNGEADAYHFRTLQSLGIVCTIVGDATNSPYTIRSGESLNNAAVTSAAFEVYSSQHDP